jgi:hypothetical protein
MSLTESKYGSGSGSGSYKSDDSIVSIKSNESYTTNQEGTDWCAAHSTSRLLARLLISKNTSPAEYNIIGICLLNLFTQNLQKNQPFLYDSFIHDVIGKINNRSFNSELECFQKLNKYLGGVKFKVIRITNIPTTIPNKPAILSIGGTKDFVDTFNEFKASTADRPNRTKWDEYNAKNPNQCNKPFGHSLFLKSYNKMNNTLHIKDADGYDYFDVPLDLIRPAIKEIIYLKKYRNTKSLKGGKIQQVIQKTRKNKNKKAFR